MKKAMVALDLESQLKESFTIIVEDYRYELSTKRRQSIAISAFATTVPIAAWMGIIAAIPVPTATGGPLPILSAITLAGTTAASSTDAALAEKEARPAFLGPAYGWHRAGDWTVQRHHERRFAYIYKYNSK
jgi:hypothetical protein